MSGWLEALLGKVLSSGVNLPLSKGLNFKGLLAAALNPATKQIDVTLAPPTVTSARRQVLTSGAAGSSVGWDTLGAILPSGPIYDVMAYPFNAVGDGVADDTAAINAAIAAANITSGAVHLGRRHKITGPLTPFQRDAISLVGRGCRGDGTLLTVTGATPYNVITVDTVKDCVIRDMFIEGPGTWASRGLGIFIDDAFRTRVERVEIQKTYGAIEIYASVITEIIDTYAAAIYGPYAFYAYGSLADGENHALRFRGCATGTDVTLGTITWYKQGSGSHTFELINCGALHGGKGLHVCDDTAYGTDSTPRFTRAVNFQCEDAEIIGVHLQAGATASFTQTLLLSCLGNAFQVDSTYGGNWEVNGGMIHGADGHGMSLGGPHWSVTGLQIGNIDAGKNCIDVGAAGKDFSITGCSLGDIFSRNSAADYGISLNAGCDRFTITGNRIIGNDVGTINNPAGAAATRVISGNVPHTANAGVALLRGVGLTVDTSNALRTRHRPRRIQEFDYFATGSTASGSIGKLGWNLLGSGATYTKLAGIDLTARKGHLETGAVANNRAVLCWGDAESRAVLLASETTIVQVGMVFGSTASVRMFIGLSSDFAVDPTTAANALGFLYDSALSANWQILARIGSAGSPVDGGGSFAAAASSHRLFTIRRLSTGVHEFYIGNSLVGSIASGSIPTAAMNIGFRVETLTAAVKSLEPAYFGLNGDLAGVLDDDAFLEA